jgi:hypothetical protein
VIGLIWNPAASMMSRALQWKIDVVINCWVLILTDFAMGCLLASPVVDPTSSVCIPIDPRGDEVNHQHLPGLAAQ